MIEMQPVFGMQERWNMRSVGQLVGLLLAVSVPSLAQSVRPEFEAATVKASRENGNSGVRATTGRLTLEKVPLRVLVSVAYKTRPSQIVGGPSWRDSARFNIQGKADEAAGTDPMLLMLQALLEDRFQLKIHREIREGAVYELTVAKGGPRLKPSSGCVPFDPNHLPRQAAPGEAQVDYCGRMSQGGDGSRRTVDGKGVDMVPAIGLLVPSLTGFLSEALDRTVINKTGLTGAFDFHLEWETQRTSSALQPDDSGAPSIFTAMQEQLGLKLGAAKGPVEFLVIDRAERPAVN
jgi:uncharacterized protein (TIGR03435 family)